MRSAASSVSVSTISTHRSDSRSRTRSPPVQKSRPLRRSISISPPRQTREPQDTKDTERKRRRTSFSSQDSHSDDDRQVSRERGDSRSTRRRFQERSPPRRGRRTESRSPHPGARTPSKNGRRRRESFEEGRGRALPGKFEPPRERSLSPFSKRIALTQSLNSR